MIESMRRSTPYNLNSPPLKIERLIQQLEDLNGQHNAILNDRGNVMIERDKLNHQLTAQRDQVEKLRKALSLAHDKMDDTNTGITHPEMLCVWCESSNYNGGGIVHGNDCILLVMRQAIADTEAK